MKKYKPIAFYFFALILTLIWTAAFSWDVSIIATRIGLFIPAGIVFAFLANILLTKT